MGSTCSTNCGCIGVLVSAASVRCFICLRRLRCLHPIRLQAEPGLWGSLTADTDKHTIKQQRDESVRRAYDKQVEAQKQRLQRKAEEEK